jgi:hypothetical protein
MTRRLLSVCGLTLVLALPGPARAGEVKLSIRDGRVTLSAQDASLRQILLEWERVGGTRVFNRDRVPATALTLELTDVPEPQALATVLRSIAGYVTAVRLDPAGGASRYSRIILMPGEAAPVAAAAASPAGTPVGPMGPGGPFGRGTGPRRVLPDGRVIMGMDDPSRSQDADANDDTTPPMGMPGIMRPPFGAPGLVRTPQDADDPTQVDTTPAQSPGAYKPAPGAPVSISTPGVVPATKPLPATPVKPPGD